jgi:hypothetical protein
VNSTPLNDSGLSTATNHGINVGGAVNVGVNNNNSSSSVGTAVNPLGGHSNVDHVHAAAHIQTGGDSGEEIEIARALIEANDDHHHRQQQQQQQQQQQHQTNQGHVNVDQEEEDEEEGVMF